MSRRTHPSRLSPGVALAILAALLAAGPVLSGRKSPAPYELAIEVAYGEQKGPESLREWAEREIVHEVDEAGCFSAARAFRFDGAAQSDLLVRVVLDEFEEHTEYEMTLAQRADPYAPPAERSGLIARLEVRGQIQMRTLPERHPVRQRVLHADRGYRPTFGEDAEYEVRRLLVEALAQDVRRWLCKGARKKLRDEVERARAQGEAAR